MKSRPLTLTLAHFPNLKKKALQNHHFAQFMKTAVSRETEMGLKVATLGTDETGAVLGLKSLRHRGWADTIPGSYIQGVAAVESIAMDGQSIGSKVTAAVTHNSDSQ